MKQKPYEITANLKQNSNIMLTVKISLENQIRVNPSRPRPRQREKNKLNFYFHTSLRCLKWFYEGPKGLSEMRGTGRVKIRCEAN